MDMYHTLQFLTYDVFVSACSAVAATGTTFTDCDSNRECLWKQHAQIYREMIYFSLDVRICDINLINGPVFLSRVDLSYPSVRFGGEIA